MLPPHQNMNFLKWAVVGVGGSPQKHLLGVVLHPHLDMVFNLDGWAWISQSIQQPPTGFQCQTCPGKLTTHHDYTRDLGQPGPTKSMFSCKN